MIDFKKACCLAMQYLKKHNGDVGLAEIAELPDRWIFNGYGGGPFGSNPVTVSKVDGFVTCFSLAFPENQVLYYDVAVSVDVPEEFR